MNEIRLSEQTYHQLKERAAVKQTTPDLIAESIIKEQLATQHSYIEVVERYGGPAAVIAGTRISVADIVGYLRIGETPESIVSDVLTSLTLAQVYAALSYYHDHQEAIDAILSLNNEEVARVYLRESLGEEGYRRITGQ